MISDLQEHILSLVIIKTMILFGHYNRKEMLMAESPEW